MKRTELKRGTKGLKRGKELKRGEKQLTRKRAKARSRKDTWPARVRKVVRQRSGDQCERCPSVTGLQLHHRRIKGIGGDTRPHTDCACNALNLCAECHRQVHREGRAEAGATGYVVSRSQPFPGSVPVMIGAASGSGASVHLSCEKPYYTIALPERSAA